MSENYRELLIGCGHSRAKRLDPRDFEPGVAPSNLRTWRGPLETLDYMVECRPDWVCNLNRIPWQVARFSDTADFVELPEVLPESVYDEVHAYEVLEHLGRQGDYRSFFDTFSEIWRILKPGGYLLGTCPSRFSQWLWGDPGHTRAILPASLVFLSQPAYDLQCGQTSMSDYRREYRADFDILACPDNHETHSFYLRAVKPSRITLT